MKSSGHLLMLHGEEFGILNAELEEVEEFGIVLLVQLSEKDIARLIKISKRLQREAKKERKTKSSH